MSLSQEVKRLCTSLKISMAVLTVKHSLPATNKNIVTNPNTDKVDPIWLMWAGHGERAWLMWHASWLA